MRKCTQNLLSNHRLGGMTVFETGVCLLPVLAGPGWIHLITCQDPANSDVNSKIFINQQVINDLMKGYACFPAFFRRKFWLKCLKS